MSRRSEQHLVVNPIRCDGFGHCVELCPELITLDEWGYPIIAAEQNLNRPDVHQSAKLAVKGCPRGALEIRRVKGS